jgi:hypothetical protein
LGAEPPAKPKKNRAHEDWPEMPARLHPRPFLMRLMKVHDS